MSQINSYTTLSAAILAYPNRTGDADYTNSIDTFIGLGEASFNRKVLSRRAEMSATLTTDADGFVALPADFIAPRSSNTDYGGLSTPLNVTSQGSIAANHPFATGGNPYDLTFIGDGIYVNPIAERDVVLDYYAKFVGLSASNATNWVILNHPDYYLNACLKQACIFLRDVEGLSLHQGLMTEAENEIMSLYSLEAYFNAGMTLEGNTP